MSKNYSISKLHTFEGCPRQYDGRYNKGLRMPPGPAAKRGLRIHELAENYLDKNIRGLPRELEPLRKEYAALRRAEPLVELKMAVNEAWKPASWSNGWARGVVDAIVDGDDEAIIIDHKTGRIYEKHGEQAAMYACLTAASVEVSNYHVEFWYIDQESTDEWDFKMSDIKRLRKDFDARANKMFNARKFPARPEKWRCKWCPVASNNGQGGKCTEWKKT